MEGDGSGSGLAVSGVERVVGGVLMIGHTPLSALSRTGSSDEIAQLLLPLRSKLLSLHSCRIFLLH
jgi:hypothetical protein